MIAQPRAELKIGLATKLVESLMGPQKRLLDDVGGVELPAEPGIKLHPSQQPQVLAVVLQRAEVAHRRLRSSSPLSTQTHVAEKTHAAVVIIWQAGYARTASRELDEPAHLAAESRTY